MRLTALLLGLALALPVSAQETMTSPNWTLQAPGFSGGTEVGMAPLSPGVFGSLSATAGSSTPPGQLTSFPSLTMLSAGFWPIVAALTADCEDPNDFDCDGLPNETDLCPFFRSTDQTDTDGDGRGDVCACGDQSGDGIINVADILLINLAIFEQVPVSPLCDANNDGACNVGDILAVNARIFGASTICARHPEP